MAPVPLNNVKIEIKNDSLLSCDEAALASVY